MKSNKPLSNVHFENRNRIFDYMRSMCVFWIVACWHINAYMDNEVMNSFSNTNLACEITYCVLSSFTFMSGYFSFRFFNKKEDVIRYYLKKVIRLYPLFVISAILLMLLKLIDHQKIFKILTIIGGIINPIPITLWYVCVIMTFYIFVPIINRKNNIFAIMNAMIIEICFIVAYKKYDVVDSGCCIYWLFFVFGNMVRRTKIDEKVNNIFNHSIFNNREKRVIDIFVLISFLLSVPLFCYFAITSTGNLYDYKTIIASFWGIIGLYFISFFFSKRFKLLYRIIIWVSYSSMCVYLFHREMYEYVCLIIGRHFNIKEALLVVPMIFIIGFIIQRIYDRIVYVMDELINKFQKS